MLALKGLLEGLRVWPLCLQTVQVYTKAAFGSLLLMSLFVSFVQIAFLAVFC